MTLGCSGGVAMGLLTSRGATGWEWTFVPGAWPPVSCGGELFEGAVAGWTDSWESWSLLARDFRTAFSRSRTEFLSYSSLICSFNTSTSSRTAYIRWLLTKSFKETVLNYKLGSKTQSYAYTTLYTHTHTHGHEHFG